MSKKHLNNKFIRYIPDVGKIVVVTNAVESKALFEEFMPRVFSKFAESSIILGVGARSQITLDSVLATALRDIKSK